MERSVFSAGTTFGSPSTTSEVKTLICYLLEQFGEKISFEQLHTALLETQLVNYFELSESLNALVDSQHISKISDADGIEFYQIDQLGKTASQTLDNSLPTSVRDKAIKAVNKVVAQHKRLSEVSVTLTPLDSGGYNLRFSIPQEDENLISFELYAPTKAEADQMKINFLNDPVYIYKTVLALLTRDHNIIGELKPSKEKLFDTK